MRFRNSHIGWDTENPAENAIGKFGALLGGQVSILRASVFPRVPKVAIPRKFTEILATFEDGPLQDLPPSRASISFESRLARVAEPRNYENSAHASCFCAGSYSRS